MSEKLSKEEVKRLLPPFHPNPEHDFEEDETLLYQTWTGSGKDYRQVEVPVTVLRVGGKRVFIRHEDGKEHWCEPRKLRREPTHSSEELFIQHPTGSSFLELGPQLKPIVYDYQRCRYLTMDMVSEGDDVRIIGYAPAEHVGQIQREMDQLRSLRDSAIDHSRNQSDAIDAIIREALPGFPVEIVSAVDCVKELARQLQLAREKIHESY